MSTGDFCVDSSRYCRYAYHLKGYLLENKEETRLLHTFETTEESFYGRIIAIITIVVLNWGPT